MFALAQAPPDHAHRLRTQRNRRTSFSGRRSRCGADLIAAVGDRCPVGATADRFRADDGSARGGGLVSHAVPLRRQRVGLWPQEGDHARGGRRAGRGGAGGLRPARAAARSRARGAPRGARLIFTAVYSRHMFVYPAYRQTLAEVIAGWILVHGQAPGLAGVVPSWVAGCEDAGGRGRQDAGHECPCDHGSPELPRRPLSHWLSVGIGQRPLLVALRTGRGAGARQAWHDGRQDGAVADCWGGCSAGASSCRGSPPRRSSAPQMTAPAAKMPVHHQNTVV
jgi:hypothetical protein